jgi:hypothetical protein
MENNFIKMNQQCFQNLVESTNALSNIETKGESTMLIYKIRVTLIATLEQIQKDNQEKSIEIDNTKDKKEDK